MAQEATVVARASPPLHSPARVLFRAGLRPRRSDVAEGPHFYNLFFFASAFDHAGLDEAEGPLFFRRFSRVGLRPRRSDVAEGPHFFERFSRAGLRPRRTDVAEGPHFFNLCFFASAFGDAGQMWPKAHIFTARFLRVGLRRRRSNVAEGPHFYLRFLASAFGDAGPVWPKAHIFTARFVLSGPSASTIWCGRRPTFFQFVLFCAGLRPRRENVAEGQHSFNSFCFASPFGDAGPMWLKAHIF